jgi:hypothetical protein
MILLLVVVIMIRVFTTMINAWSNDEETPTLYGTPPEVSDYLKEAVTEKDMIGWEHWF